MGDSSGSPSPGTSPARDASDRIHASPPVHLAPVSIHLTDRKVPSSNLRSSTSQQTYDNPLLTFDDTRSNAETGKTSLEEYVSDFARKADLEDRYELLLFGARLARDKHAALSRYDSEITDPEKTLLEDGHEKTTGFWKQSKFFRATIMTASLGGMIQGWTQSVNNGTIYGMPKAFGLKITNPADTGDLWIFGMLNAIPLLSAGLFGTTLADPLQEYYLGRRGSIMVSAAITIATTIGASVTHNVGQLAACRAINGIALGAKASVVPIYSAEISPEHIRGGILANWQLADAAGIFLGFLANLIIVFYVEDSNRAWRILTNTVLVPTIPLMVMIYLMPESPRYLMKHGSYRRALDAFTMIQTTPLLASRDFMYAHAQLDFESKLMHGVEVDELAKLADRIERSDVQLSAHSSGSSPAHLIHKTGGANLSPVNGSSQPRDSHQQPSSNGRDRNTELNITHDNASEASSDDLESALRRFREGRKKVNPYEYHIGVTGYFKRLVQLWSNMRCRRALRAASIAMITQQLTGINTIALLGTSVWVERPDTRKDYEIAAAIGVCFGAANYLGGLPAYWFSDKFGRSIMLAVGLPNTAWSMLVFALLFKIPNESDAKIPLVSIFAIIFTIFYAPTAGTSPFSISAEVFPLVSREVGMAVSVAVNLLGAGSLALVFPFLMDRIGKTGALSIFAGLNLVAFFLVYLFVPETRRRTLEELQFTFDLRTTWHVEYRAVYIRKHLMKNFWRYLTRKPVKPPVPFYLWARITHGEAEEAN